MQRLESIQHKSFARAGCLAGPYAWASQVNPTRHNERSWHEVLSNPEKTFQYISIWAF
ncbi:hypothetical protein [uncultured Pelagimonas sp.]|uniref:hypothetical protein n=1 Tax=uncultured Pelagimonas sp. TaxID=1618102 RepID=UPI0026371959|nr:hypothetical protein [uncultured Pelagimonas sp.]